MNAFRHVPFASDLNIAHLSNLFLKQPSSQYLETRGALPAQAIIFLTVCTDVHII